MNGFSNDWFGSGGFRTMGAGVGDPPIQPSESFTPWSHGAPAPTPAPGAPPRLQMPAFGPAHSFALMGGAPGFLGAVRVVQGPVR